jgi:hypothetical protein
VDRDSGTDRVIGGWLQRLDRPRNRESHNKIKQIQTLANPAAPHLLAVSNRRELNPGRLAHLNLTAQIIASQTSKVKSKNASWPNEKS